MHYLQLESGHEEAGAGANRQAHEQLQSKARASVPALHTQHIASHPGRAGDGEGARQGATGDALRGSCQTERQERGKHAALGRREGVGMVSLEAQPLLHRGENPKPSAGSPRSMAARVQPRWPHVPGAAPCSMGCPMGCPDVVLGSAPPRALCRSASPSEGVSTNRW